MGTLRLWLPTAATVGIYNQHHSTHSEHTICCRWGRRRRSACGVGEGKIWLLRLAKLIDGGEMRAPATTANASVVVDAAAAAVVVGRRLA